MTKTGRMWFPLDADFTTEDKITDAGERAGWLYLAMLGRIKRGGHHGTLTRKQVAALGVPGWDKRMAELLRVGLVIPAGDDCYRLPAWDDWQGDPVRAAYMREWRARTKAASGHVNGSP